MYIIAQRIFTVFIVSFIVQNATSAHALIGEVSKDEFKIKRPQVVDVQTKIPVSGALVSIPAENKKDFTTQDGYFKLSPSGSGTVILSIQKDGYRPYSVTINDGKFSGNMLFEMQKASPKSIIISNDMMHLGDNSYSDKSSGACLINSPCVGPFFIKKFKVGDITPKTKAYVTIGSVIGIDTIQAMKLGQNKLTNATSTPMEIFVNGYKIAELKINGDNQKIPIPLKYLNKNSENVLKIQTGVNMSVTDYTDYDDVEIVNLIVDIDEQF